MTQLLLFNVTNGLIIGAFYVLMALGLSLILNLSNVINFAHGGFLVIGGDNAHTITPNLCVLGGPLLSPPPSAPVGPLGGRGVVPPPFPRGPPPPLLPSLPPGLS